MTDVEWLAVGARLRALVGVAIIAAIAAVFWLVIYRVRYHGMGPFWAYFILCFVGVAVIVLVLPDLVRMLVDWVPIFIKVVRHFINFFFSTS